MQQEGRVLPLISQAQSETDSPYYPIQHSSSMNKPYNTSRDSRDPLLSLRFVGITGVGNRACSIGCFSRGEGLQLALYPALVHAASTYGATLL